MFLMNSFMKKILLYLYFIFQCFAIAFDFKLFFLSIYMTFISFILGQGPYNLAEALIKFFAVAILIVLMIFIYLILTVLSAIGTKNMLQHKPLTKLQKFSSIIFLISIPFLLYLIFKI